MPFFRRRHETLNEQLLREAGLEDEASAQPEPEPAALEQEPAALPEHLGAGRLVGLALERPARYDSVLTVDLPGLRGDRIEFATLPEGDVIVDDEEGDTDLSPLADAVEKELEAPYRVVARHQEGDRWTVAARRIDVLRLDFDGGDEIELVSEGGSRELRVDGEPWSGEIPELERAAEAVGHDHVVQADRLDGDLWEIRASAL